MNIQDLKYINDTEWEIPKGYRHDMRVPVRIFATRELLEQVMGDKSLEQAVNATTLPGLVGAVVVMPDMHQGYGFPIGGVAATEYPRGVISPGAIGYDINCGVRLLASSIEYESVKKDMDMLATALNQFCPSGVGKAGVIKVNLKELEAVLRDGSAWALKNGYATQADLDRTEESGTIKGANPASLSDRAKQRGLTQIGSMGAGNHFVEVDVIEKIFDEKAANAMGLQEGMLAVQIHCGSRGLGHQVCTDYVREFQGAVQKYGINLPDRELVCAPMDSPEGQAYLGAMSAAANFAFVNRQLLAYSARRAFEQTLAGKTKNWHLHQVYDIAHNMGKIETHEIEGTKMKVCVHRKGATRAFGPGSPGLPPEYQAIGQPVIIPGSMGTASWVLTGTKSSMLRSFGSTCHGAGRLMSRTKAKKIVRGDVLRQELEQQGIHVRAGSLAGLAEEAPLAYKDVDAIVETVSSAGIAKKVARLKPVAVIKG
ncbi:MAG: RtcB family protein [Anaerolineae bacterium]|nr:RtcB family protein [Anaerolineae bacterium]MDK1081440.1 RtcB family protein [Anaerolineae bacterium]